MLATLEAMDSPGYSLHSEDTESVSSTASSSVTSSSLGVGGGGGRSQRYKVALTAMAKQRRMRRMKEKEREQGYEGSGDTGVHSPGRKGSDTNAGGDGSSGSHSNANINSAYGNSRGKPFLTKDQSESSRWQELRDRALADAGKSPVRASKNASSPSRGDQASRGNGNSIDDRLNHPTPQRSSTATDAAAVPPSPSETSTNISDSTPKISSASSKRPPSSSKKYRARKTETDAPLFNSEEFLPNDLDEGLSPEEVRDAANFTSIQFQCTSPGNTDHAEIEIHENYDSCHEDTQTNVSWQNEVWSEATTPSILQKSDIFHHKAAASIVSLLSPERLQQAGLLAPEGEEMEECPPDVNGDSPTGVVDGNSPGGGKYEGVCFDGGDPGISRGGEWIGTEEVTRTLFPVHGGVATNTTSKSSNGRFSPNPHGGGPNRASIKRHNSNALSSSSAMSTPSTKEETRTPTQIYAQLQAKMIPPSQQLSDLLTQIHHAPNLKSIDRAYATRRKNACGALKILSAKECNRLKICWTIGVLDAISSMLEDVDADIYDTFAKSANTEGRNRIVATLLNLSVNKKNRMLICNAPGVLEAMKKVILHDEGESRQGCCTVLMYLSKTPETRPFIVACPGLVEALSTVIEVPKPFPLVMEVKKKGYRNRYLKKFRAGLSSFDTVTVGSGDEEGSDTVGEEEDADTRSFVSMESSHSARSGHSDDSGGQSEDENDDDTFRTEASRKTHSTRGTKSTRDTLSTGTKSTAAKSAKTKSTIKSNKSMKSDARSKASSVTKSVKENEVVEVEYDADPNRFLHGARLSTFACLLCLVKHKDNAFNLARCDFLIQALIEVSNKHTSPSHARAISLLAHLTRHPKNCHHLVFKYKALLPTLEHATGSPDGEARKYSLYAIQNLSMDKSCRAPIGHTPKMIWSLTDRCKRAVAEEEVVAAVAALQNLSDEPANLIQFTIVKDCVSTIITLSRGKPGEPTDLTAFMAKNTIGTLSHWFRKIATSGSERIGAKGERTKIVKPGAPLQLHGAVLQPTQYNQWT
ncbi:hypothetical protein ACHAXS_009181 [Conticribra weissflogii]